MRLRILASVLLCFLFSAVCWGDNLLLLLQSGSAGCGTTCFRVVQVAGRTTTGTQDFTVASFGTPDGYLLSLTRGVANGSAVVDFAFGLGAGHTAVTTAEWVGSSYDEDSQNPADVGRTAGATSSLRLVDLAGGIDGEAAYDSTVTDGIRLDYASNALASAYLINTLLIKAANVTAGTGTHTGAINTSQTFTVGHTVDVVLFFAVGQLFDQSEAALSKLSIGAAVNGGGQWCASHSSEDNVSPTNTRARVHNDRVILNMANAGTIFEAGEITSYPANAFAMTKRDTANDVRFAYLAIDLDGGVTAWAGVHSTPTSTGQQVVTTPSFTPQFLLGISTYNDTINTSRGSTAGGAGSIGLFMADATNLYAHHIATETVQTVADTQSMSADGSILVATGTGAQVFDVDTLSFTASGWNWTFNTSVPAAARLWPMLAISN